MIYKLYVIEDVKASYGPQILSFANDDIATRWFSQLYRDSVKSDPNGALASFPEDFRLCYIGTFDTDNCEGAFERPEYICHMTDFMEVNNNVPNTI